MSNFSPELLLEIARTADSNNRFLRNTQKSSTISFDDTDKAIINEFKDAVFTALMLRAAESLKTATAGSLPQAHTYFAMTLFDKDVHPTNNLDPKDVEEMYANIKSTTSTSSSSNFDPEIAKNVIASGPITFRTLRSTNETPEIKEIMDGFDNFTITLTCD